MLVLNVLVLCIYCELAEVSHPDLVVAGILMETLTSCAWSETFVDNCQDNCSVNFNFNHGLEPPIVQNCLVRVLVNFIISKRGVA